MFEEMSNRLKNGFYFNIKLTASCWISTLRIKVHEFPEDMACMEFESLIKHKSIVHTVICHNFFH